MVCPLWTNMGKIRLPKKGRICFQNELKKSVDIYVL
jgi:hypothetical protein